MKIVEIRGYRLWSPLPEPVGNSTASFDGWPYMLVELVSDSGLSGWGETAGLPALATLIRTQLVPIVLGQDPTEPKRLWRRMAATAGYDRRGLTMMAIAALDIALHDLAARAIGAPVSKLLGGALRDRVLAYASGPFMEPNGHPYRNFQAKAERFLERGFRAIKPRAGFDPREDGAMVASLRRAVGVETLLMVDINQAYTASAAIDAARRMEPADLRWIEEPVGPEDIPGYRAVARATGIAVAGGEALGSLAAFRDFVTGEGMAILQPDIGICGGYTGLLRVAALAEAFDLPLVPHVWGTTVNFHASLQLIATLAERRGGSSPYPFVEYDANHNPLLSLLGAPELDREGMVAIPDAPGTGIELDRARLEPWLSESWVERLDG